MKQNIQQNTKVYLPVKSFFLNSFGWICRKLIYVYVRFIDAYRTDVLLWVSIFRNKCASNEQKFWFSGFGSHDHVRNSDSAKSCDKTNTAQKRIGCALMKFFKNYGATISVLRSSSIKHSDLTVDGRIVLKAWRNSKATSVHTASPNDMPEC